MGFAHTGWVETAVASDTLAKEGSGGRWFSGLVRNKAAALRKGDYPTFRAQQGHRASCGFTCDPMICNECGLRRDGIPGFEVTGLDLVAYGACHLLVDGCRIEPVNLHGMNVMDVLYAQHMPDVLDDLDKIEVWSWLDQ